MTEQELRNVAAVVRRKGGELRHSAGMNGRMDDGGGGALIAQVDAFEAGLAKRLPSGWERYAEQAKAEADPEYAEFRRLRAKFAGR